MRSSLDAHHRCSGRGRAARSLCQQAARPGSADPHRRARCEAAKLSASDLWKDFQTDPGAARTRYFGAAIDLSDRPTAVEPQAPGGARVVFAQTGERGVIARLLDERAAATLEDAKAGARLTLRCFCEGLDRDQNVLLKSCVRP
jgi:hypothetical protein